MSALIFGAGVKACRFLKFDLALCPLGGRVHVIIDVEPAL